MLSNKVFIGKVGPLFKQALYMTLTQELNYTVIRLSLYFIHTVDGVNANMWHQTVDIILAASLTNPITIFPAEMRSERAVTFDKAKVLFLFTVVKATKNVTIVRTS